MKTTTNPKRPRFGGASLYRFQIDPLPDFPETDVTILVSASTAKALGEGLEPFTAGSHVLRGRGEPIEIYRIA